MSAVIVWTCGHRFPLHGDLEKRDGVRLPKIPEACPFCGARGWTSEEVAP